VDRGDSYAITATALNVCVDGGRGMLECVHSVGISGGEMISMYTYIYTKRIPEHSMHSILATLYPLPTSSFPKVKAKR
jgi:hypothetical protein